VSSLKVLTVSTKGGVGKSTISMQLVAPYLYEANGKQAIKYYECDDTNKDVSSYGATSIISRHLVSIGSPMLREELFDIVSYPASTCIDVGGNNTAKVVIDALDESGGLHFIDMVLIPTLDGEQDMLNALDTYQYIKSICENMNIVFVLNRVKEHQFVAQQFDHFFGDSRGVFNNFLAAKDTITDEELELYISFLENDVIRYSRRFGLTVYEISNIKKAYLNDIREHNDPKVASFKHFMSRSCQKYSSEVLTKNFAILDEKLRR
jgi:hypothetical protein